MYLHSRKYLLDLFFKFFCFFQISCISSLKTHLTVRCVFLKTCFPIILHCLQHGTFGLLLATNLGIGIQFLSLDLKDRFQVEDGSDRSCRRSNPASFFKVFQRFQCDVDTGFHFFCFENFFDLCGCLACITQCQCIQNGLTLYRNEKGDNMPKFHTNVKDMLEDVYKGTYKGHDLAANTQPTILDKNLKMPSTWKSSLALDLKLPGDVNLNIEGIYNKDFNSVTVTKLGMVEKEGGIRLPGEPEARTYWESGNIRNKDGETVNPYLINNTDDVDGYYASVSAQVSKTWGFGLSLTAAYTYSSAKNVIDGIGDQVTSAFSTNTFNKNGSNVPELGYASYVSPHRILLNVGYRLAHKSGASNFGLYYEAFRQGYIGSYSYSRYSYTMYVQSGKYQNPVTNDRGAVNLIYIPTREELDGMPFTSDENREEYWKFIRNDDYLSKHTGEYSKRGGAVMPWQHMLNFRFSQDFYVNVKGRRNTISLGLDVNNIANMLNRDWGNVKRISTTNILKYENGAYTFNKPTWSKYAGTISTWSAMFSIRYTFN